MRTCVRCHKEVTTRKNNEPTQPQHVIGRGLCYVCYRWANNHKVLSDYPVKRRDVTSLAIYENYNELAAQGYDRITIANRLGLKIESMDRTLFRLRKKGYTVNLVARNFYSNSYVGERHIA